MSLGGEGFRDGGWKRENLQKKKKGFLCRVENKGILEIIEEKWKGFKIYETCIIY